MTASSGISSAPLPIGAIPSAASNASAPVNTVLNADVFVYGATPAGIMGAIAAARAGASVIVCEDSAWFGGALTGGLSWTDVVVNSPGAQVVGLADAFFAKDAAAVGRIQQNHFFNQYNSAPHINAQVLLAMVANYPIRFYYNAPLVSAAKSGTKITSVNVGDGTTQIIAGAYIDASYEGDLIAAAGCTVSIGRESTATYGESLAGGVIPTNTRQVPDGVDPYVTPGVPASGLIPMVSADPQPIAGAASPLVMGFGYRLTVTKANNRVPMPQPDAYDPAQFEALGRYAAVIGAGFTLPLALHDLTPFVAGATSNQVKTDANSSGPFSTDYVHPDCTEYITATRARRAQIRETIKQYTLGLFKFLATDSRIPAGVRTQTASYGLCPDEYQASGGFTPFLYLREGRRLVGDFVMKQSNLTAFNAFTDPIAYGYYPIDSHSCWTGVVGGQVKNEGAYNANTTIPSTGAYVPYRALQPKVAECTNLLSPTCPSVSRVVFCSIRVEPVLMAMGEAAGIAAALSVQRGQTVQSVNYADIKTRQNIAKVYTALSVIDVSGVYTGGTLGVSAGWSQAGSPGLGIPGNFALISTTAGATVTFSPNIPRAGMYRVGIKFKEADTRSNAVPITINSGAGPVTLHLNQQINGDGADFIDLGAYAFDRGSPSANNVVVGTDGLGGSTIISAVSFTPAAFA